MAYSISAIKTAYDTFKTAQAATATAQAAITSAGQRPLFPVEVITDTDYTNIVTAQASWDSANGPLIATLATEKATQRTAEIAVITAMKGGNGGTYGSDVWTKLTGAGGGVLTYTNWIAYPSNATLPDGNPYLIILTAAPTKTYINQQ